MKKQIIILILSASISPLWAQRIEFGAAIGHQFGGAVDESEKDRGTDYPGDGLVIKSSPNFNATLSYRVAAKAQIELSVDRQSTQMNYLDSETGDMTKIERLSVSYYQIGALYDWSHQSVRPFAGASIGVADFVMAGDYGSEKRFVASPILGVKILAGRYAAFRLQTRVFLSNMPSAEIFPNSLTGDGFHHHKNTFLTQMQVMAGVTVLIR